MRRHRVPSRAVRRGGWNDIITTSACGWPTLAHAPGFALVKTRRRHRRRRWPRARSGWCSGLRRRRRSRTSSTGSTSFTAWASEQIGIAYSDANSSRQRAAASPVDGMGLTAFGHRAVTRDESGGPWSQFDLSHASDRTALDTCAAVGRKPVFITHAEGPRRVGRHRADEAGRALLRAVARERAGVDRQCRPAPHTTLSHPHPSHTIESVMDHFPVYCVDLVGLEARRLRPATPSHGDHVRHAPHVRAPAQPVPDGSARRTSRSSTSTRLGEPHGELRQHLRLAGRPRLLRRGDPGPVLGGGNIYRALRQIWI